MTNDRTAFRSRRRTGNHAGLRLTDIALIRVNVESLATGVQQEVAARGGVATVEPPPDEADVPNIQNGEPTSVEAFLGTGAGTNEEASAGFCAAPDLAPGSPPAHEWTSAAKRPARRQASSCAQPSRPTARPTSGPVNAACASRWAIAGTPVHEHADWPQYHHQDGAEAATMVELRTA